MFAGKYQFILFTFPSDGDAIPADEKSIFGVFVTNLMKSAPEISLTFKIELTLVLLLHYSKVKKDFPGHSLLVLMLRAMPEVVQEKESKLEEWESYARRQFVHKNNVYVSDPSFLSGDFSISTSTIRHQHGEMIHKIDQLGCDVMALDGKVREGTGKISSLEGKISSLEGEILELKRLVLLMYNRDNTIMATEDRDIRVAAVTPSSSSPRSSSSKRSHAELEGSEHSPTKMRSYTILDSFSGVNLSTAFFQYYTENLPQQVKGMTGSGFAEQRSNYTKIHRVVCYMKRFQEEELVIEKKPSESEHREMTAWINKIRELSQSLETKAWEWIKTQGEHKRLTKACKSCETLFTKYKEALPQNELVTDNFIARTNVINDEVQGE